MDTEFEAIKQRERFKELEQRIQDMLQSANYRSIVKELDHSCKYSTQTTIEVIRILYNIKRTGLYDKKKLQKVMNHYVIEHEDMLVLKP